MLPNFGSQWLSYWWYTTLRVSKPKTKIVIYSSLLVLGVIAAFVFFLQISALISPCNTADNTLPVPGQLRHSSTISMEIAMVVILGCSPGMDYKHMFISFHLLYMVERAIGTLKTIDIKENIFLCSPQEVTLYFWQDLPVFAINVLRLKKIK